MGVQDSTEVTGFTVVYQEANQAEVSTDPADSVDYKSATLNGEVTTLNVDEVEAYFEYRETGSDTWNESSKQQIAADELVETLDEATGFVEGVAFSNDNNYIAYSGDDENVYVHNVDDWSLEETLTEASDTVGGVYFSEDSSYIAYASDDNNVYVHNVDDWSLEETLTESSDPVDTVEFSNNGDYVAYGEKTSDANVYVHNVDDWSLEETLTEATDDVKNVTFSEDNNYVAYTCRDENVYVHNVGGDWSLEETLTEATGFTQYVDFSDDNQYLAYSSSDENVYVHNVGGDWSLEETLDEAPADVNTVRFNDDSSLIAYSSDATDTGDAAEVYMHSVGGDWTLEKTFSEASDWVYGVDFSENGEYIAYGSVDENVYVHNASIDRTFSEEVSDLDDDTEFEFRAVIDDTDGNRIDEGESEEETTTEEADGSEEVNAVSSLTYDVEVIDRTFISSLYFKVAADGDLDVVITDSDNNELASETGHSLGGDSSVVSFDKEDYDRIPEDETLTVDLDCPGDGEFYEDDDYGGSSGDYHDITSSTIQTDEGADESPLEVTNITGGILTFTTDDVETTVETDAADNITVDSADLNGDLTTLGDGLDEVEVYFEYRETGEANWDETSTQTLDTEETFTENVDSLSDDTDYEFRAIAQDTDGYQLDEASTDEFTTESSTADFEVTIDSTRDPFHQQFYVEVDVENTGNDEATQTIELEYEGEVEDSEELTLSEDENDSVTLTYAVDPDESTGDKDFTVSSDDDSSSSSAELRETHVLDQPTDNEEIRSEDVTFEWETRFDIEGQVRLFATIDVEEEDLTEENADFTEDIGSGDLASGAGSESNNYSEEITVGSVDDENWTVTFVEDGDN